MGLLCGQRRRRASADAGASAAGRCRERRGHEHVPDAGSAGNSGGLFRAGGGQLGVAFHGGRTLDGAV